jgi:hypothetical protein
MARINLHGREIEIHPVWFLSQGYCDKMTETMMAMAESGQYTPESSEDRLAEHIGDCDTCSAANAVKSSIVKFLNDNNPELVNDYMQGKQMPREVVGEWVSTILKDRLMFGKCMKVFKKVSAYADEFRQLYS